MRNRSIALPISLFSLTFGWLSSIATAFAQTNYEYDALGRLVEIERVSASKTVTYTFDAAGNRTSVVQATIPAAEFSVNDVSVTEGGGLSFTVSKSGGASQSYDVSYATANSSAGSGDYTSVSGTLSFISSETSKTVSVQTTQDSIYESAETLSLNLSNPTNGALLADSQGIGTINNDDGAPSFAINNVTVTEGSTATFTVTKSGSTALSHNINYATANSSANGSDYTAKSGTLTFAAGETSKTVSVSTTNDSTYENTENFLVNLSGATNGATIADSQGIGGHQ